MVANPSKDIVRAYDGRFLNSVVLGHTPSTTALATGDTVENSVAIFPGTSLNDIASGSVLIGASGTSSEGDVAIGTNASITAGNSVGSSVVVGEGAKVEARDSVAIGASSLVAGRTAVSSVALGEDSVADEANTVSIGHGESQYYRRVTNVADGVGPHDAATVGQLSALIPSILTYARMSGLNASISIAAGSSQTLRNFINSSTSGNKLSADPTTGRLTVNQDGYIIISSSAFINSSSAGYFSCGLILNDSAVVQNFRITSGTYGNLGPCIYQGPVTVGDYFEVRVTTPPNVTATINNGYVDRQILQATLFG